MLRSFLKKTVVALIAFPLLLIVLYKGGWWLLLPLIAMALVGMGEYYSATYRKGHRPAVLLGFVTGIMILGVTQFSTHGELREGTLLGIIIVMVGATLVLQFGNRSDQSAVDNSAITAFGVIYVPLMLSFLLRLRQIDLPATLHYQMPYDFFHFTGAALIVIVPVWLSDTFAMAVGAAWGKHKLAPTISPGKTLEGLAGGFLACIIGAVAIGTWIGMPWYHAVILGIFEGIVGPLGDLGKSVLKRDLGIKDFGNLFGAHGGVLDRFDAIMFSMPLVYLYLWLFFLH